MKTKHDYLCTARHALLTAHPTTPNSRPSEAHSRDLPLKPVPGLQRPWIMLQAAILDKIQLQELAMNTSTLLDLPVEQRLHLVEELWDSIAADQGALPLSEAQRH